MDDVVFLGVLLLGLAVLLLGLAVVVVVLLRLASWSRRRDAGHALMGPFDEIRHPSGGHAHVEAQEQHERVTPAPSPGDRPDAGGGR